LRKNPVTSVLGLQEDAIRLLASSLGIETFHDAFEVELFQRLRSLPRAATAKELNNVLNGKLSSTSINRTLDALYAVPRVTPIETNVHHSLDNQSQKIMGCLRIKLEVDQHLNSSTTGSATNFATIIIVLGTMESRLLLGKAEFSIGRGGGKTVIEKEIMFDWNVAKANGGEDGGTMLLHFLPDNIRGMDCGLLVKLL
jgi:hypothetical protein